MKFFALLSMLSICYVTTTLAQIGDYLHNSGRETSQKLSCGLHGSVEERVQDCNYKKEDFVLVARLENLKEVHKELSSGLLWSDILNPFAMGPLNAEDACNIGMADVTGIEGKAWRLPNSFEYFHAEKNGIRNALPNMDAQFWTSTIRNESQMRYGAYIFNGYRGDLFYATPHYYPVYGFSVRCVAL